MLSNLERCKNIVHQLSTEEQDPFYCSILQQIATSVKDQSEILQAKIKQLNDGRSSHTVNTAPNTNSDEKHKNVRKESIEDTIISKSGITFDDIAGLQDAKQALHEAIIMPLQYPHLFTGSIKPWKRILMYGPPGTGKSRLAQALSSKIDSTFYSVSSSDLVSSWVGESEKLIKELFQHAFNQSGRSVIFIDEIDSICRQRSSREEEYTRRIKTELLKQMEGADNSDMADKIFLLCATNCPWELDSAFLRRFQKRIYIPLPDRNARLELMKINTKQNKISLTDKEWELLVDQTEGYSGSDISNMILEALFGPIRDLQKSLHWKPGPDGMFKPCEGGDEEAINMAFKDLPPEKIVPREVTVQDFMNSVRTNRKTISESELKHFHDFTQQFGETG